MSQTSARPFNRRYWIQASLFSSVLFLVLTTFVLSIQMLLASLGDELGSQVALGVALMTGAGLVFSQLLLVSLLALHTLDCNMEDESSP